MSMRLLLVLLSMLLTVGCSGPAPGTPSPDPGPAPPPPPPPVVQSSASLGIDDLFVIMYAKPPFWFDIRFLLRETGGTSGATLQTVFVGDHSGGGELAWVECWRDPLRVPPGGTLDTFYTQAGWDWLSYCGPWYGGAVNTHNLTAPVTIHVTFLDDEGRPGVYNFRGEARLIVER